MTLDLKNLIIKVSDHAASSGVFDRVQGHEPKNAPGHGVTVAYWAQNIGPVPAGSGLSSTTARVELMGRIYGNALAEPMDEIDPNLTNAVDVLLTAYSGDFELGGSVRNIDLLGAHGTPLQAVAGYITIGGTIYRCMDITIPLIVSDVWSQSG